MTLENKSLIQEAAAGQEESRDSYHAVSMEIDAEQH